MEIGNSSTDFGVTFIKNNSDFETGNYSELGDFYQLIFDGFALPIIGLLGIIGNILSLLVLTRRSMRSSANNIVLIGLTASDLLFVISMIFVHSFGFEFGKYGLALVGLEEQIGSDDWIYWFVTVFYPLVSTSCTGSHLFTVLITLERYIAVCHPLKAAYICSPNRAKKGSWITAIVSVVISLPTFFDFYLANSDGNIRIWYDIYYTTIWNFVAMTLLPFCILIVFNVAIYREIRKSVHIQKAMVARNAANNESTKSGGDDDSETQSLALLLFGIVLTFLLCKTPQIVTDIMYFIFKKREDSYFVQVYLSPRHFLDTLNSCVNFIFYCLFGQKFRSELVNLFKNCRKKAGIGVRSNGLKNGRRRDKIKTRCFSSSVSNLTKSDTSV